MMQIPLKSIDEIQGVTLEGIQSERDIVLRLLKATLPVASELAIKAAESSTFSPLAIAANAALNSVITLVAAATPKCNLAAPAEDIDVRVDSSGNMIFRCRHNTPHEWDLGGRRRP